MIRSNDRTIPCLVVVVVVAMMMTSSSSMVLVTAEQQRVTGLYVVDCITKQDIVKITEGMMIDLRKPTTKKINDQSSSLFYKKQLTLRAEVESSTTTTDAETTCGVTFTMDMGWISVYDETAPYYVGEDSFDNNGLLKPVTTSLFPASIFTKAGLHVVRVTPNKCDPVDDPIAADIADTTSTSIWDSLVSHIPFLGTSSSSSSSPTALSGTGRRQLEEQTVKRVRSNKRNLQGITSSSAVTSDDGSLELMFEVILPTSTDDVDVPDETEEIRAALLADVIASSSSSSATDDGSITDVKAYTTSMEGSINGLLEVNQPLTIAFLGPDASETSTSLRNLNFDGTSRTRSTPFADYRADMTIESTTGDSTTKTIVPCYYGLSDHPANNDDRVMTSGSVWYCHYTPTTVGTYTYTMSFKVGANIAAASDVITAESGLYFDQAVGTFEISDTSSTFPSQGRLQTLSETSVKYLLATEPLMTESTTVIDERMNVFESTQYDNTNLREASLDLNPSYPLSYVNGTFHSTWKHGRGKNIIGYINQYKATSSDNTVIDATVMEGYTVSPFVDVDIYGPFVFDISKLGQWYTVLQYATVQQSLAIRMNLAVRQYRTIVASETSTKTTLSAAEMIYYREMVSRFSHFNGIMWDLGSITSPTTQSLIVQYIRSIDTYENPIIVNGRYYYV